jgi:hypothetical protein
MRTNWAIGIATAAGIIAGVLWGGIPVSGQEATPPAPDLQAAQREIDQKIEDLQRQKEALQRQAEQQEVLADLQKQARERKDGITGELNEIRNAEATTSPAVKAQREARMQHLETQGKAVDEVLAMKDVAALPKVREIFVQMADRDNEWDIAIGPRHDTAVMIEELEIRATGEEGTEAQRKLLERIRASCKENMAARDAQFQATKAVASKTREIETLVEQFHSGN